MGNVLPSATGLTVDGVIYRYSAVKSIKDPMIVNIQNSDALQPGFVFRSQDDWSGLPGNTITRVVPVDNIPISRWGSGSITIDGIGEVIEPSVIYKYKYDTCYDPLSSPSCPGYAEAIAKQLTEKTVELYDPLKDPNIKNALDTRYIVEEEKRNQLTNTERKNDKLKEKSPSYSPLSAADNLSATQFELLNNIPGFELYKIAMPGGVYNDILKYSDKKLPDSKDARRLGLAQENLHRMLVDLQYKR